MDTESIGYAYLYPEDGGARKEYMIALTRNCAGKSGSIWRLSRRGRRRSGKSLPWTERGRRNIGQWRTRPVVVIQNNIGNRYGPTVIVAAITTRIGKLGEMTMRSVDQAIAVSFGLGAPPEQAAADTKSFRRIG